MKVYAQLATPDGLINITDKSIADAMQDSQNEISRLMRKNSALRIQLVLNGIIPDAA